MNGYAAFFALMFMACQAKTGFENNIRTQPHKIASVGPTTASVLAKAIALKEGMNPPSRPEETEPNRKSLLENHLSRTSNRHKTVKDLSVKDPCIPSPEEEKRCRSLLEEKTDDCIKNAKKNYKSPFSCLKRYELLKNRCKEC